MINEKEETDDNYISRNKSFSYLKPTILSFKFHLAF